MAFAPPNLIGGEGSPTSSRDYGPPYFYDEWLDNILDLQKPAGIRISVKWQIHIVRTDLGQLFIEFFLLHSLQCSFLKGHVARGPCGT